MEFSETKNDCCFTFAYIVNSVRKFSHKHNYYKIVEFFVTEATTKITTDGNSELDVNARIAKATGAFAALRTIWKSTKISTKTKVRIFKSNVLGVLLYGAESWKVTHSLTSKLDVFQTKCLRRILRIFWPNTISNAALYERKNTTPLSQVIKRRRWTWIGHINRMHPTSIPKGCTQMDASWKEKERKTKRDVAKIGGERDERQRLDVGTNSTLVPGQTGMEISGDGLMCFPARRGLSK